MVSVMLFKKKGQFLKMVAYAAADSAPASVKEADLACFLESAHGEISGALLFRVLRQAGDAWRELVLDPAAVMPERVVQAVDDFGRDRLRDEENGRTLSKLEAAYPEVLARAYVREIGGVFKLKVLMGKLVPVQVGGVKGRHAGMRSAASPAPAWNGFQRERVPRKAPVFFRKLPKNSGKRRMRGLLPK
jgi:hypothetical protein